LDPNSAALHHIRKIFPRLADANVKGGIFTGPQIRVMLASRDLEQTILLLKGMLGRPSEWKQHIFLARISAKIMKN
jgi:hypothetical protein